MDDNAVTTDELRQKYHNREVQPLTGVSREYLLARFALAIFTKAAVFAKLGFPRTLIVVDDSGKQIRSLPGEECRVLAGVKSKSRSASPKKRSRSTQNQCDSDLEEDGSDDTRSDSWEADQWGKSGRTSLTGDNGSEEEDRGRPKKRRRLSCNVGLYSPEPTPSANTSFGKSHGERTKRKLSTTDFSLARLENVLLADDGLAEDETGR